MEKSLTLERLTILYTGGLRGDLSLLPRLYSFLKQLKRDETADRVILIDIGDLCSAEVWHCAVTGGRSMIIALDGMGYDIVHAEISNEARAKLGDNIRAEVVSLNHTWHQDAICVYSLLTTPPYDVLEKHRLFIYPCDNDTQPSSADSTHQRIEKFMQIDNIVYLPPINAGQVGRVRLQLPDVQSFTRFYKNQPAGELPPEWLPKILSNEVFDLPPATPPDPTIAGMVEFILSEARYAQKKASNAPPTPPQNP